LSGFVLDLAAGELLTADHQLAGLRKQALDVLLLLGARAGQVVSKDELMRAVWPDVVVGESSLAKAVSDIRQVLRDHDHRLLRNVARRGYMLAADPRPRESAAQSPLSESVPSVSLVVLPLRAERGTVAEQIADAITADLTNGMDRMSGSCVIGHETATSMYRGKDIDPRIAARELGVRYVVAGSLRRLDERLRLGLAMVDGESGLQLWSDQLDVNATEIESSVDDIVGQLTRSVFVQLFHAVGDRAARLTPELVTADDLAMRGWSVYFRVLSGGNFREALRLFEEALAKDPNSVRALAGVSTASSFGVMLEYLADRRPLCGGLRTRMGGSSNSARMTGSR
jgi:TolB-like protein